MAEVLGVVASGIAVAQAVQTIGGAILSLSRLWREVKDVPDTIQNTVEDLEVAGKLVDAIESELGLLGSDASLHDCSLAGIQILAIHRCRQIHQDLDGLVKDLSADIASSRRRKSLLAKTKVVLKKDTLENYERRLQRALRLLDSAVQLHLASSIKQQPELVSARITTVLTSSGLLRSVEEDSTTPAENIEANGENEDGFDASPPRTLATRNNAAGRKQYWSYWSALFGHLGLEYSETEAQSPASSKSKSYRVRLSLPRWLLNKAWDLQLLMACSGWTAHFRQYVVLPRNAEVFQVVKRGTSQRLLELFDKGLATPFCVDEYGRTLLHWAAYRRWDFVELLLQLGLDPSYIAFSGESPSDSFFFTCAREVFISKLGPASAQELAIHRLMLSHGAYDKVAANIMIFPGSLTEMEIRRHMLKSVDLFDLFRTHLFPNYYERPLEDRLNLHVHVCGPGFVDRKAFDRAFRPDGQLQPEDLRNWLESAGQTVLHRFAATYVCEVDGLRNLELLEQSSGRPASICIPQSESTGRSDLRPIICDMISMMDLQDLSAVCPQTRRTMLADAVLGWRGRLTFWPEYYGDWYYSNKGYRIWRHVLQEYLKGWLAVFVEGGHELEEYGKAEAAAFEAFHGQHCHETDCWTCLGWPPQPWYIDGPPGGGYRWKGFKYGPRPEGWDLVLEWDPPVEEFVGDFWAWIENPPLSIPGAWVDDDDN